MKQADKTILAKVLKEIEYVDSILDGLSIEDFMVNETTKRATGMTLINIGELARHLSEDFQTATKYIPWRRMIDLRNVAAHGYYSLRFDDIWLLTQTDLPDLKSKIDNILKNG